MEQKTIKLTDAEIMDIRHGLVIAMKELDKYDKGSDKKLADRLEIILNNIELQTQ